MDQITEIQSNIHGSFSGNAGDHNVLGNDNITRDVHTVRNVTNFGVINQGCMIRTGDREPPVASRPYWIVPYSRNSAFTGRNSIIESVKEFSASQAHNRVALHGLGGSGKTQIALEYVYQRASKRGCDVFWVHGSGLLKFSQGYRTIAQHVSIPRASAETNEEKFLFSIKAWFEGPESGDWILVIDNADNEEDFLRNDSTLSKFVPQGKGTVIFTTRSQVVASRQGCNAIEVSKMAREEAQELFSKCFPSRDDLEDEERKVVPMILDSLDYLPLAVVGAAAFMAETKTSPSDYWSIFQKNDQLRTTLLMQNFSDIRREADVTEGILGTYFITFDRITTQMPTAAGLLRLIAFFDRQNILEELVRESELEGIDDPIKFRLAIGKLLGFSLVTDFKREGKTFYELHRLIQLSIRAYLSTEELNQWKAIALRVISRLIPRDVIEWRYGGTAAAYIPHALAMTQDSTDPISEDLISWMGHYFLFMGAYDESEAMFRRVLEARQKVLGPDHLNTLRSADDLASVLQHQRRYSESEKMSRRALEGKQKVLGPNHQDTLATVHNLASLLQGLSKYHESEMMFRRVLEGEEKVLGPDHPGTLITVHSLASVLQDLGRYGESEAMSRHALESTQKALGPDHPGTLRTVHNLASVLQDLGRYGESEAMSRRVLEGRQKALGPDHPTTLASVNNLASVLQDLGRYGESEAMFRRVLEGEEKVRGPDHPDTLIVVHNLASVLQDLGRYGESEAMSRHALESTQKALGPDHPGTLTTAQNLAFVLQDLGRYGESEAMSRRALEGRQKALGPDHPTTLASVKNLASVLQDLGRCGESEAMSRRALEGRQKALGPDHPDTLTTVNNLALVLQDFSRYGESETMFQRALEGRQKVLGPDHPKTLRSVHNLALVLRDLGRYSESEMMFRRVLEREEKVLGPDHPDTLTTVNNLASVLQDLGRYDESETMSRRVLEGRQKALGPEHPKTLRSAKYLAVALRVQGKYDESETVWRCVLEARMTTLGPEHYKVCKILARLAGLQEKQRKYSQAEEAYELASKGFLKTLGRKHPTTLECIWKLTALREKNSVFERISFEEVYKVVNVINHRRSPNDRRRHFESFRRRKRVDGMTLGKRLPVFKRDR